MMYKTPLRGLSMEKGLRKQIQIETDKFKKVEICIKKVVQIKIK